MALYYTDFLKEYKNLIMQIINNLNLSLKDVEFKVMSNLNPNENVINYIITASIDNVIKNEYKKSNPLYILSPEEINNLKIMSIFNISNKDAYDYVVKDIIEKLRYIFFDWGHGFFNPKSSIPEDKRVNNIFKDLYTDLEKYYVNIFVPEFKNIIKKSVYKNENILNEKGELIGKRNMKAYKIGDSIKSKFSKLCNEYMIYVYKNLKDNFLKNIGETSSFLGDNNKFIKDLEEKFKYKIKADTLYDKYISSPEINKSYMESFSLLNKVSDEDVNTFLETNIIKIFDNLSIEDKESYKKGVEEAVKSVKQIIGTFIDTVNKTLLKNKKELNEVYKQYSKLFKGILNTVNNKTGNEINVNYGFKDNIFYINLPCRVKSYIFTKEKKADIVSTISRKYDASIFEGMNLIDKEGKMEEFSDYMENKILIYLNR